MLLLLAMGGLATLKFCQDRGWHPAGGAVAAIAFAFGASAAWRIQHIAQIQSLAFFALTLWLLMRALVRSSAVYGALAGAAAGLMVIEPNQVALLGCYVLAGTCAGHWLCRATAARRVRRSLHPLGVVLHLLGHRRGAPVAHRPTFSWNLQPPRDGLQRSRAWTPLHPASLLTTLVADLFGASGSDHRLLGALQRMVEQERAHAVAEHEPVVFRHAADRCSS